MAKKITKQDFAHIETSDAAFNQMMANLPNIDIDPYASERERAEESEEETVSSSAAAGPDLSSAPRESRRGARRTAPKSSVPSGRMTNMPVSERGRDSLNLAKQFYCMFENVRMTREEFLLMVTEKALKKLSPKAYEYWKTIESTRTED